MAETHSHEHEHSHEHDHIHFAGHSLNTAMGSSTSTGTDSHNSSPLIDGRRNSHGDILASPIDSWKPDFKRTQSFKQEDLKRTVYSAEMIDGNGKAAEGGFTEGGEGTRHV
jgi:hypothetical protein